MGPADHHRRATSRSPAARTSTGRRPSSSGATIEGAGKGIYNWTESDRVVKASNANGIKIIARIDFQPDWARKDKANNGPPDNYQDYADFITAFAGRYKPGSSVGTVDAIEIWNEVNLTREWGMQPINQQQAADYVRLLTLAYRAAHAANPSVIIIQAGLSPTGVHNADADDDAEYMGWLFQAGLKGGVNYDVLGAHGNTQAPCVGVRLQFAAGVRRSELLFPPHRAAARRPGQVRRQRSPDLAARVRLDGGHRPPELRVVRRQRGPEGQPTSSRRSSTRASTGRRGSA